MDELHNEHVLFETLRVRKGVAEYVQEHLARLQQSIAALGSHVCANFSEADITQYLRQHAQSEKIYRLRLFATKAGGKMTFEEYQPLEEKFYTEGVSLMRVPHPDLHRAPHKFWQRPAYHDLLVTAQSQGFQDVLLCDGDELLETATSNFFLQLNGEIIISSRHKRLPGVMEQIFLQKSGMPVREEKILWPLPQHAACYISSSLKGIVPVKCIDHMFFACFPLAQPLE